MADVKVLNLEEQLAKSLVQAAARTLLGAALDLMQADPHSWSLRDCSTCRSVTTILGKPFGCYKYQADQVKSGKALG